MLANTDSLTHLYNRRQLYPMMQKDLDRAVRRKVPFSVLLIDIDHFKKFNDTYGHAGGDLLLAGFADKMRSALRQMDSAFRFGGEEFVVLLPETTGARCDEFPPSGSATHRRQSVFHAPG